MWIVDNTKQYAEVVAILVFSFAFGFDNYPGPLNTHKRIHTPRFSRSVKICKDQK